jgi:hypothetical protein
MRCRRFLALCLAIFGFASHSYGHGNPIDVTVGEGRLTVANGLSLEQGFARLASDPHEDAAFDFAPNQKLRSTYPGYDISGIAPDSSLQFEILPRPDFTSAGNPLRWLWFWSSATQAVAPVPNDALFHVAALNGSGSIQSLQSALVAGPTLTMASPIGPHLGADRHLLVYELLNYAPGLSGAYGVFARLSSPGLVSSEPFLLLFRFGIGPESFAPAAQTINLAAALPGDFNHDEAVNAADYTVWRNGLGTIYSPDDYAIWKNNFGVATGSPSAAAWASVPEPTSRLLVLLASFGVAYWGWSGRRSWRSTRQRGGSRPAVRSLRSSRTGRFRGFPGRIAG